MKSRFLAEQRLMGDQVFGKFIILKSLGENEMSEEFICQRLGPKPQQLTNGPMFRLQRFRPHLSVDKAFKAAFDLEGKKSVQLNHPNICPIVEFGREAGQAYILTNFSKGHSLEEVNQKLIGIGALFPPEVVLYLGQQIAQGLAFAHTRESCHWGLSPHSIFISNEGQIKSNLWGLYPALSAVSQKLHPYAHPPWGYISPELLKGDKPDARADLFSIGVILWELLTGRPYSSAASKDEAISAFFSQNTEPPSSLNPECPKPIDEAIMGLLCLDRQNRSQRGDDLSRELGRLLFQLYPSFSPTLIKQQLQELFLDETEKRKSSKDDGTLVSLSLELAAKDDTPRESLSDLKNVPPAKARGSQRVNSQNRDHTPSSGAQLRVSESRRQLAAQEEIAKSHTNRKNPLLGLFKLGSVAGSIALGLFLLSPQLKELFHETLGLRLSIPFSRAPSSQLAPLSSVNIKSNVIGFTLLLNDEPIPPSDNGFLLPTKKPLRLVLKRAGYETIVLERTFTEAREEIEVQFNKEVPKGFLTFLTEPAANITILQEGKVFYQGETPLQGLPLPVGTYQALVENQILGFRKDFSIRVDEALTTKVQTPLK